MELSALMQRLDEVKDCMPVDSSGELAMSLIKVTESLMRAGDPLSGEYSLAYLLLEAVIDGELVPKCDTIVED